MNTYYHSFSHYKQELPKTNFLVFVGMNNNKLITKGFLTSNVSNFYIIDKTKGFYLWNTFPLRTL